MSEIFIIIIGGFIIALGALFIPLLLTRKPMRENDATVPDVKDIPVPEQTPPKQTPGEKLAEVARTFLGVDASPMNRSPQELSCAEGVSHIIHQVYPDFPANIVSTIELDSILDKSPHFKDTKIPSEGCVIMSPREGDLPGHCGIYVSNTAIASNDSRTGKFEKNYDIDSWITTFKKKRGLHHIYFYEAL